MLGGIVVRCLRDVASLSKENKFCLYNSIMCQLEGFLIFITNYKKKKKISSQGVLVNYWGTTTPSTIFILSHIAIFIMNQNNNNDYS